MRPLDALETALRYPWHDGETGVTLVVGGILTLLSPLVLPGLVVLGYGLRVVEDVMDDRPTPPSFREPGTLLVRGVKAAVVIVAYVAVPLAASAGLLGVVAGAAGFRFDAGVPSIGRAMAAGGLVLVVVLLLAGVALVAAYLAPAALVHLARTRRLGAAFSFGDVRSLAGADAYGSAWLLALAVFVLASVVLAVLNAAAIGVIVSGFVTFYAFVAMAYLYAVGATRAGYALEAVTADAPATEADA